MNLECWHELYEKRCGRSSLPFREATSSIRRRSPNSSMSSTVRRQYPPVWPRQPVFKNRLTDRFFIYSWALNPDRFLWTGFVRTVFQTGKQKRVKRQETGPVTGFSVEQGFPCSVLKPVRYSVSYFSTMFYFSVWNTAQKKTCPEKPVLILSSGINKKSVRQPVFF